MTLTAARTGPNAAFVSTERIYADANGKIVGENDPNRVTLVVAKGGTISAARARFYGILPAEATADMDAAEKEAEERATPKPAAETPAGETPAMTAARLARHEQPVTGSTAAASRAETTTPITGAAVSAAGATKPATRARTRSGGSRKK